MVLLDSSFGWKSSEDQQGIIDELQMRASAAGLRGTVVPVWESSGRPAFIAPRNWLPFFEGLTLLDIAANVNTKLYW